MTKLIVKSTRPRNPLVAAARARKAGPHGSEGAVPREGRRDLRRELASLDLRRDRPSSP